MKKSLAFLCLSASFSICANAQTDSFHLTLCSRFWKTDAPVPGLVLDLVGNNPALVAYDQGAYCGELVFVPVGSADGFCGAASKIADDFTNGVTVADLLLLRDHILGIHLLDSLGEKVAADVVQSNTIVNNDLLVVKNLLLGLSDTFPNGTSWRMLFENFHLPNPANPFDPPCAGYSYSPGDTEGQASYRAVKIGDVDGDADPEGHYQVSQAYSMIELLVPDLTLEAGQSYEVPIAIKPTWTSRGVQFAFRLDTAYVRLDSLENGEIELQGAAGNLNYTVMPEGTLRLLAMFEPINVLHQGYPMFTCHVKALQPCLLREKMVNLLDTLPGLLVDYSGKIHPLKIKYYSISPANELEEPLVFDGISPNPFSEMTRLTFRLSSPDRVRFEIFTLAGQLIFVSEKDFTSGFQQLDIPGYALPENALLLYSLQCRGYMRQGKLFHGSW